MAEDGEDGGFYYAGFAKPNYTQLPDDVVDVLLPELTEAELKVLLYIVRRTFGFKQDADAISLTQLESGITTKEGRVLDRGTGMSRSSVRRGVKGLTAKGIITVAKVQSGEGDYESNVYALRMAEPGVVSAQNHPAQGVVSPQNYGGSTVEPRVVLSQNPQETVVQETVEQETDRNFEDSKETTTDNALKRDRYALTSFIADFAREFGDQAPLPSSITRAARIKQQSKLSLADFVALLYEARARTKEHSGNIKTTVPGDTWGRKNRMAYFFAVLEQLAGLRESVEEEAS